MEKGYYGIIDEAFRMAIQMEDDTDSIIAAVKEKITENKKALFSQYPNSDTYDEGYFNVFMNHLVIFKEVDDTSFIHTIEKTFVLTSMYYGADISMSYKIVLKKRSENTRRSSDFISITKL